MNSGLSRFHGEAPANIEERLLCTLVIDVSGSMDGATKIGQVNEGLRRLEADVKKANVKTRQGLEICIVTFADQATEVRAPSLVDDAPMPVLGAGGYTALVDGIRKGIEVTAERMKWYKQTSLSRKVPYIVVMTDGDGNVGVDQDVGRLAADILRSSEGSTPAFNFWAFGTDDAEIATLKRLSTKNPVVLVKEARFDEFFKWVSFVSRSVSGAGKGATVDLDPSKQSQFLQVVI